jgi:fatty-acyl-CoA synthase
MFVRNDASSNDPITRAPQMLTPLQRRQALEDRHPAWRPMTISQALDSVVAEFAARPLIITDRGEYSYREVQSWSRELAAGLIAEGVCPGDHVALVLGNFPAYVALKYAISRIGAVAVPVNYLLRRQELSYILEQSDSTVLIVMDQFRDRDYLGDLDAIVPGWETLGGGSRLPKLRRVYVHPVEGAVRQGAPGLDLLAGRATPDIAGELERTEIGGDPHFRADVIYTSGTTGLPKGVMLTHDMVLRAAYASAYTRAFEDGRRIMFSLPMHHVFGYVECLIASTFVGGAIIPQIVFDAEKMLQGAEQHRASELVCVPMMTLKLLEAVQARGFDSSSLLAMFNSGGSSPPSIWQDIRSLMGAREVFTAYGMTETTASTTCTLPDGPDSLLLTTNGRFKFAGVAGEPALQGTLAQYKTIDPVTGADLPRGAAGELMARGPIVTTGYYRKPDETAAAFDKDGWLHTGDIGVIDEEENLVLTGRLKESYRCGGETVTPKEIEDLLSEHPLVAQAFAIGIPDPKMGEVGCVCIVPASDARPEPEELIRMCEARLARFKVPRHVLFIGAQDVPLTATGKLQRFRLVEMAKQRLATVSATTAQSSRTLNSRQAPSRT